MVGDGFGHSNSTIVLDQPGICRQLADRVRHARANLGLAPEQVAARPGVALPEVSEIESGKRAV